MADADTAVFRGGRISGTFKGVVRPRGRSCNCLRVRMQVVLSEEVFASQKRVSGFPEKGADLRGSPGNFPGKSRELPGKSGKLPGNLWIAVKFHSERTSGEAAEKLPEKFGELPGKSGDFPEARGSLTPSQRLAKFVFKVRGVRFSGPVPRSVQKVSRECPRSVKKVSRTLPEHSRDTFWTLRSPGPEGPQRHPEGHSRDTSGPKGPERLLWQAGGVASLSYEMHNQFEHTFSLSKILGGPS